MGIISYHRILNLKGVTLEWEIHLQQYRDGVLRWQIIKDTETVDNWTYEYKFLNRSHLIHLLFYVNLAGFGQNAKVDTTYIKKLKHI